MAAAKGNKNAEKWDEETTLKKLDEALKVAQKGDIYSLVGVLLSVGVYSEWWAWINNKFKDNDIVLKAIKDVENAIERNIVENTMTGTAKSAAFSIFLLKNKFGYKDKIERDDTVKSEVTVIDLGNGKKPDDDE